MAEQTSPEIWAVTAYEGCGCSGGISIVGLYATEAKAQEARAARITQRFTESQARAANARAAGHRFVATPNRTEFEEHFNVEGPYGLDQESTP